MTPTPLVLGGVNNLRNNEDLNHGLQRELDSSFPKEYDRWEINGATYVIQDLSPEDDEEAVKLLVEHLCPDEALCAISGLCDSPESVQGISEFWRHCLPQRMSLACYTQVDGVRTLVGANVCVVTKKDENSNSVKIEGKEWQNVYYGLEFLGAKCDPYEYLGVDTLLAAYGLVVRRDYRGLKLGDRLLSARGPLCAPLGVKATSTAFTGVASQKVAARCGFTTIAEATFSEMSDAGLKYPKTDHVIKQMVKKFQDQ